MSKYVGHSRSFTPVISLSDHCLLTYQHGDHDSWVLGDTEEVMVNHEDASKRIPVQAVVRWVCKPQDFVLLETKSGVLDFPSVDVECCPGRPYLLIGTSARSQSDPISSRHGSILSTKVDEHGYIRGDTSSVAGDSGGGCFSLDSKSLFAMNVATTSEGSVLLPIAVPYAAACNLGLAQAPPASWQELSI